jgi:hypothetical protein
MKIEKVKLDGRRVGNGEFKQFLHALKDLRKGESFLYNARSHHRLSVSILQHLFDRTYTVRKVEEEKYRIGRIS